MITTLLLAALTAAPQAAAAPVLVQPQRASGGRVPAAPAQPAASLPHVSSGNYGVSQFGYADPHPPGFHPFVEDVYTATRLEESVLLTESYATLNHSRWDDQRNGGTRSGRMPGIPSLSSYGGVAMGDLRGDGRDLVVTVGFINGSGQRLRVLDRAANGDYFELHSVRVPSYSDIEITCADVDGDGRDEVACAVYKDNSTRRHEVWVIDDLVDGPWGSVTTMPLVDWRILGTGVSNDKAQIAAAQLDGDPRVELFVAISSGSSNADLYAVDDLQAGLATLAERSVFASQATDFMRICSADTDGDGIDEIAVSSQNTIRVQRFTGTAFSDAGSFGLDTEVAIRPVGWDRDGSGIEEIGFLEVEFQPSGGWPPGNSNRVVVASMRRQGATGWNRVLDREVLDTSFGFNSPDVQDMALVALEDDNDGRQELRGVIGLGTGFGQIDELHEFRVNDGVVGSANQRSVLGGPEHVFLVAGDDDGETVRVRWTGQKELRASAPVPIVVMEAVPTKAGVAQNHGASGSTFSSSSGTATSFATTSSTTIGVIGGLSSPDFFGLFEAEAKATISGTVATTTGSTQQVRTFTTYGSSHDVHSIVFQGTLYHSYLYEVIDAANPAAIGSTMALNVPVATNEWKWTLAAYNAAFPNHRIDPDVVFAHAAGATRIGDPTSYPSRSVLEGYVTGPNALHNGWIGGSSTVGEGFAYNGFGLALGSLNTTTTERTLAIDTEVTFAAGGTVFGGSFGVSSGSVHTVETSRETEYAAQIGDLEPSDYPAWNYTAGMVVYQDRITAEYPFQVIRYWTDPTGLAYP